MNGHVAECGIFPKTLDQEDLIIMTMQVARRRHGFFAPDALPNDTTAATRARIVEVLGGAPVSERR